MFRSIGLSLVVIGFMGFGLVLLRPEFFTHNPQQSAPPGPPVHRIVHVDGMVYHIAGSIDYKYSAWHQGLNYLVFTTEDGIRVKIISPKNVVIEGGTGP
jgi:hypothetical protein